MVYSSDEIRNSNAYLRTHEIKSISLFELYARSEANEDSDVDFYIDKEILMI